MRELTTPRFRARLAATDLDIRAAQSLRQRAFRGVDTGLDADPFDARAVHLLVENTASEVLATFRMAFFAPHDDLAGSYAAQFYDLTGFATAPGRKAEIGRFCLHPQAKDGDLLRLCWAALARMVTGQGVDHLFGCSSLSGASTKQHGPALAWLAQNARGPSGLRPAPRHAAALPMAGPAPDASGVPALLRFYLGLGGWTADHAMIDTDLDTVHVFTALDISALSPARARRLAAMGESEAKTPPPVDAARRGV